MNIINSSIIANLKLIKSQWKTLLIFLIFPILVTFMQAFLKGSETNAVTKIEKSKLQINFNNNENLKYKLSPVFDSEEVQKFYKIDDSKPDIILEFPQDLENKISENTQSEIIISDTTGKSAFKVKILEEIVNSLVLEVNKSYKEENALKTSKLTKEQLARYNENISKIQQDYLKLNPITTDHADNYFNLVIPGIITTVLFFMLFLSAGKGYHKDIQEGVFQRLLSTPNTRFGIFLSYNMSLFLLCLVILNMYYFILILTGKALVGINLAHLILYSVLYSFACSLIFSLSYLFKKDSTFMMFAMVIFYIRGYGTGDLGTNFLSKVKPIALILEYSPMTRMKNILFEIMSGTTTINILKMYLPVALFSIAVGTVVFLFVNKLWRNNK